MRVKATDKCQYGELMVTVLERTCFDTYRSIIKELPQTIARIWRLCSHSTSTACTVGWSLSGKPLALCAIPKS